MIQRVLLDNGVHILTEDVPHVRSVVIGIWVGVGSRDETPGEAGLTHFIEHLMFKGTKNRTAKQIAEELDAVGGQLNAFTTKEYTCYYARVLDEHFNLAMDVLTDMLFNSRFEPNDIDRERNVILEEIKMYEDSPDELVHDVFATTIWHNHPLGRPIIGTSEVIESVTRDTVINYYNKNYIPSNMVVAVAGNIDHGQVVDRLRGVFDNLQGKSVSRVMEKPSHHAEITCRNKDTEQVHLCVGAPGLSLDHKNIYVFQLINTILGGGLSSRLFQEIREQRGLVYSVYSYHSSYHDGGLFCVYAGLSKKNVQAALELIFKEFGDIKENGVRAEELRRAKDQVKGNLLLSLESVNTRMSRLAKSQLYLGKIIPPEELVERVNMVTNDDIIELSREMLSTDKFALATVGPWDDCNLFKSVIGRLP